jgi:prepilin-type N-terminal cleavage/methylation domain-containing protein
MKNKGFTLIELLLVIALLSIAVGITSDILVTLVRGYNKTQVMNELEQQANFVSSKLQKELKSASLITAADASSITFSLRDGTLIKYSLITSGDRTGVLQRSVGTESAVDLTDLGFNNVGGVKVSCPGFGTDPGVCFSVSNTKPQVVTLNLEFKQSQVAAKADYTGSVKINDTVVIRGTY